MNRILLLSFVPVLVSLVILTDRIGHRMAPTALPQSSFPNDATFTGDERERGPSTPPPMPQAPPDDFLSAQGVGRSASSGPGGIGAGVAAAAPSVSTVGRAAEAAPLAAPAGPTIPSSTP